MKSLRLLAIIAGVALCLPLAHALPVILGYDVANDDNINPPTEPTLTNALLGMPLGTYNPATGTSTPSGTSYLYRNTVADPGTHHVGSGTQFGVGTSVSGYEYAVARYDGQNGGYVLYYLGGASFSPPTSADFSGAPTNFWSTSQTLGLSHLTAFNGSPSVPDGGATVALLGVGLIGIALLRRRLIA